MIALINRNYKVNMMSVVPADKMRIIGLTLLYPQSRY